MNSPAAVKAPGFASRRTLARTAIALTARPALLGLSGIDGFLELRL